jgi:hypothetical protein
VVCSGVPAWHHVVAEAVERYAGQFGRDYQDCRQLCLGNPMQPTLDSQGQGQIQRNNNNNAGGSRQFYCPDNQNKRRDDRQDYRYGSSQMAAVEEEQGALAVASVRDMRAISSLSSSSSNNHSNKRSLSKRRMCG